MSRLDDAALLAALDRRYGSPTSPLAQPGIRDLALPVLRADLALLDSYRHADAPRLDCPLTVYAGASDPFTREERLGNWGRETIGRCRVLTLEGAHFFLDAQRAALAADIEDQLFGEAPRATARE